MDFNIMFDMFGQVVHFFSYVFSGGYEENTKSFVKHFILQMLFSWKYLLNVGKRGSTDIE